MSDSITREQWRREQTEEARRAVRFNRAKARLEKIRTGEPLLSKEQLDELALILRGGGDESPE